MALLSDAQKVFGIGWHKTGTSTLGACLRILGYSHKGYDYELLEKFMKNEDTEALLDCAEAFDSFEDFPWPLAYRQLDSAFPEARFILTVRSSSEVWLQSLLKHAELTGPAVSRELVYGHSSPIGNEEIHKAKYEEHNCEVQEYFKHRPHKLLVVCWEEGAGWKELCDFLGTEIPDADFPHSNRTTRTKIVLSRMRLGRLHRLSRRAAHGIRKHGVRQAMIRYLRSGWKW